MYDLLVKLYDLPEKPEIFRELEVKGIRIVRLFACYDATCKNFFGPTGVLESERHQHIGEALLIRCFQAMANDGYGYAIIGSVEESRMFYEKSVHAIVIEDSDPGVYGSMVSYGSTVK